METESKALEEAAKLGTEDFAHLEGAFSGWKWVELKSQAALKLEQNRMQVGVEMLMKDFVKDGRSRVWSLRDESGRPHLTCDTAGLRLNELVASRNASVPESLKPAALALARALRDRFGALTAASHYWDPVREEPGFPELEGRGLGESGWGNRAGSACGSGARAPRRSASGKRSAKWPGRASPMESGRSRSREIRARERSVLGGAAQEPGVGEARGDRDRGSLARGRKAREGKGLVNG